VPDIKSLDILYKFQLITLVISITSLFILSFLETKNSLFFSKIINIFSSTSVFFINFTFLFPSYFSGLVMKIEYLLSILVSFIYFYISLNSSRAFKYSRGYLNYSIIFASSTLFSLLGIHTNRMIIWLFSVLILFLSLFGFFYFSSRSKEVDHNLFKSGRLFILNSLVGFLGFFLIYIQIESLSFDQFGIYLFSLIHKKPPLILAPSIFFVEYFCLYLIGIHPFLNIRKTILWNLNPISGVFSLLLTRVVVISFLIRFLFIINENAPQEVIDSSEFFVFLSIVISLFGVFFDSFSFKSQKELLWTVDRIHTLILISSVLIISKNPNQSPGFVNLNLISVLSYVGISGFLKFWNHLKLRDDRKFSVALFLVFLSFSLFSPPTFGFFGVFQILDADISSRNIYFSIPLMVLVFYSAYYFLIISSHICQKNENLGNFLSENSNKNTPSRFAVLFSIFGILTVMMALNLKQFIWG